VIRSRIALTLGPAALIAAAAWFGGIRPWRQAAADVARNVAAAESELRIRSQDIAFWQRRATQDPQSAEDLAMTAALLHQRARETGDMDDYRAAERYADSSLRLRRDRNGKAMLTLASALLAQHKFPEAFAAAQELVAWSPDEPRYRALYAELLLELGDYDAARQQLDSLRNAWRDLAVAPRYARFLEFIGRTDAARVVLRRALDDARLADLPREQLAWFHLRLADLELRSGRLRAASRALDAGLRAAPDDARLWAARAREFALAGAWRDVLGAVARAGARVDIATLALQGDALAALGDSAAARRTWQQAEQSALENPEPYNRQWTLFRLEHGIALAETRALLEDEIEGRRDVYGWDQLAIARLLTGDTSGAAQAMEQALRLGTADANLTYHAALIAAARGDSARARTLAAAALRVNPRFHHRFATHARALAGAN
jgi:tetratricopeptide (TPR) repeat protein